MRTPIEVIESLREEVVSEEWIKNLYGKDEFTFTLVNPKNKKEVKYQREISKLTEEEAKFLVDNWLDKFDDRPKIENVKSVK